MSVECLLKVLRNKDEKLENYWIVLGKYYIKLSALAR